MGVDRGSTSSKDVDLDVILEDCPINIAMRI